MLRSDTLSGGISFEYITLATKSTMAVTKQKRHSVQQPHRTKLRVDSSNSRTLLIASAQKHFGLHGYKASSVHDIARDAGLNVSLVNYHFGGKEGLFRECFAEAGLARLEIAERILNNKPTSLDEVKVRLSLFIDEMLVDGVKNPEVFSIIQRELSAEFDILGDTFRKTFFRTFEILARFLGAARDSGILAKWTDPNLTALHLIGSVIHTIRTEEIRTKIFKKSITDQVVRSNTRDYLVRIFLEGLSNREKIKT